MWRTRWNEIKARIDQLERATAAFFESVRTTGSDYYGLSNALLIPAALAIYSEVEKFQTTFASSLSPEASKALKQPLGKGFKVRTDASGLPGIGGLVAILAVVRAEFEPYVADRELPGKKLVERAFLHLQRSIVADSEIAAKWQRAFQKGETACESLGACHLLLHGIWAFKASATGERTDLVLGDKLNLTTPMQTAADAMALTEWKIASAQGEAAKKAGEAKTQAALYSLGSLAGFEIRSVRYLVVVTEDRVILPDDITANGITYRQINIAVDPSSPSVAAKSAP